MRFIAIAPLLVFALTACSTPRATSPPHEATLLEAEAQDLADQASSIDAYREWLQQADKQLLAQQQELQNLIAATRATPRSSPLAAEEQYRLLLNMNEMNQNLLQFQTSAQLENRYYNVLQNILRLRFESQKEAIQNIR